MPHIVGEVLDYSKTIKEILNNPLLIQSEVQELNPILLKYGCSGLYKQWLKNTDFILQNLTISTEHKTILQMGGNPFQYWFENDMKLQIM